MKQNTYEVLVLVGTIYHIIFITETQTFVKANTHHYDRLQHVYVQLTISTPYDHQSADAS